MQLAQANLLNSSGGYYLVLIKELANDDIGKLIKAYKILLDYMRYKVSE